MQIPSGDTPVVLHNDGLVQRHSLASSSKLDLVYTLATTQWLILVAETSRNDWGKAGGSLEAKVPINAAEYFDEDVTGWVIEVGTCW